MARTALRWLCALSLLGCLSAEAASPVWAVRGSHNTVYLAGSIHMLPPDDAQLPPGFERAYADSGRLVMELDLAKFNPLEAMGWMMEEAMRRWPLSASTSAPPLRSSLSISCKSNTVTGPSSVTCTPGP